MNAPAEFLARWSRLKRQRSARRDGDAPTTEAAPATAAHATAMTSTTTSAKSAAPAANGTPPPLPDPATLGFDDDFRAFLGREVDPRLRRAALNRLFHSPQFNVMDGLDIHIDDYSLPDPIDAATLRELVHARDLLADRPASAAADRDAAAIPAAPAAPAAATAVDPAPSDSASAVARASSRLDSAPSSPLPGGSPSSHPAAPVAGGGDRSARLS